MELFETDTFGKHVEALMAKHHIVGLSAAILQDDKVSTRAFGLATLDPPKPCTPDTLFDLASSSKSMTAASIALLVNDEEKHPDVKWDTPVSKLLPDDFVMSEESYTKQITVEDMMSHRTGLRRHDLSYFGVNAKKPDTAKSVTRNLRNLKIKAPIRTKYGYCNIMYTVATHLVEDQTKASFSDFLETRLFGPLGMTSSSLQPASARAKGFGDRIATGYEWIKEEERYGVVPVPDCPEAQGAGSIVTTAGDYLKWVKALLKKESPITEEVYKDMVRQRTITDPDADDLPPFTSPTLYATGLEVVHYRGHQIVSHDGAIAGFGSTHFWLPSLNFGGVIQGNSGYTYGIASILTHELIDEVLKVPQDERVDWDKYFTEAKDKAEAEDPIPTVEVIRKEFDETLEENEPQTRPLESYVGTYHNAGYGEIEVQLKDGSLFIDATDRSFGFYLTLTHVCQQTKYAAHLVTGEDFGSEDCGYLKVEFEIQDDKVAKIAVDLEEDIGEYIWFDRVQSLAHR